LASTVTSIKEAFFIKHCSTPNQKEACTYDLKEITGRGVSKTKHTQNQEGDFSGGKSAIVDHKQRKC